MIGLLSMLSELFKINLLMKVLCFYFFEIFKNLHVLKNYIKIKNEN